ncbi:MAG TPA: hypothetical protein PLD73_02205 [Candidatus Hydrogenedentes bacterium]|jgi:hypothetical protein|nr:hypothetical protein [Candidatus Hydrogenedentota bacterium]HPJ98197.1 hypothetical protein [Candidatus Hydrogenedentota bacterium]
MPRPLSAIILAVWLALVPGCGPGREKIVEIPAIDLLLASEVMGRCVEAYENCASYRDSGVMTRTFRTANETQEESQTFSTAFQRPDRFRFQCQEGEHRYIVYADAGTIRAWWGHQEGAQPMPSLDDAIGRAVGPSNGASHTIPRLLMPDRVHGRSLAELHGLSRLSDALLEDVPCYRINGSLRTGALYTVWIDRATFLVRRIDAEHIAPDYSTTDCTVYFPELNPELADQELLLNAPASKPSGRALTARGE